MSISDQRTNSTSARTRYENAKAAAKRIADAKARHTALQTAAHTASKAVTAFEHAATIPALTSKQTAVLHEHMEQAALSTESLARFNAAKNEEQSDVSI
jgi:hypothetical protein